MPHASVLCSGWATHGSRENRGVARIDALREEWRMFRFHLRGHHEAEDHGVFPGIFAQAPSVAATIEKLTADHRRIHRLLERGDRVFAELPGSARAAAAVVRALRIGSIRTWRPRKRR